METAENFGYDVYRHRQAWPSAGCFDVEQFPFGALVHLLYYLDCIFIDFYSLDPKLWSLNIQLNKKNAKYVCCVFTLTCCLFLG